jgi:acetate kinase
LEDWTPWSFSGGIGEHSVPGPRSGLRWLEFLGIEIDEKRNLVKPARDFPEGSRVAVHVIPTDEESMIARTICRVLGFDSEKETF